MKYPLDGRVGSLYVDISKSSDSIRFRWRVHRGLSLSDPRKDAFPFNRLNYTEVRAFNHPSGARVTVMPESVLVYSI
jgi:hypothetical protein